MRWLPAGSWARVTSAEALWAAWCCYRRGKARRLAVAEFDLEADRHIFQLHRDLEAGTFWPGPFHLSVIRDPKARLIAAPAMRDRILHQALVSELAPWFETGFSDQHYACKSGRGPRRAVLRHLREQRRYPFRLGLDIRRYFPSVDLARLCDILFRRLRDERCRDLTRLLLEAGARVWQQPLAIEHFGLPTPGRGLAIGGYLSQWCGALYLDGLDHYVQRVLKPGGYLRYMDDFVLFDQDPDRLFKMKAQIVIWLTKERGLSLNPKRGKVLPTTSPVIFLGYRLSRAGISPSRKLRRRMGYRLRLAIARGRWTLMRSLQSYRGLLVGP